MDLGPFSYHKNEYLNFFRYRKLEELEKEEELREAAGLYDSEPVRECRGNFLDHYHHFAHLPLP